MLAQKAQAKPNTPARCEPDAPRAPTASSTSRARPTRARCRGSSSALVLAGRRRRTRTTSYAAARRGGSRPRRRPRERRRAELPRAGRADVATTSSRCISTPRTSTSTGEVRRDPRRPEAAAQQGGAPAANLDATLALIERDVAALEEGGVDLTLVDRSPTANSTRGCDEQSAEGRGEEYRSKVELDCAEYGKMPGATVTKPTRARTARNRRRRLPPITATSNQRRTCRGKKMAMVGRTSSTLARTRPCRDAILFDIAKQEQGSTRGSLIKRMRNADRRTLCRQTMATKSLRSKGGGTVVADGEGGFETLHLFGGTRKRVEKIQRDYLVKAIAAHQMDKRLSFSRIRREVP